MEFNMMVSGMHGTYDASGNFRPQCVHMGTTQAGRFGLFTGNYLAMSLTPYENTMLRELPWSEAVAWVGRMGFVLEAR
jgi:hypothetical protein